MTRRRYTQEEEQIIAQEISSHQTNIKMCKDCYEEWLKDATRYVSDIPIEERNFNYYKGALGL